jgi:hypothetical protein
VSDDVLSAARHLSKHDIDRSSYMERYGLSPDELIAKDFHQIQSSRHGYHPYSKDEWIAAVREIYRCKGKITTKYLQRKHAEIYYQVVWLFGDWNAALRAAGLDPETMRIWNFLPMENILAELDRMHREGIPLNARYAMKKSPQNLLRRATAFRQLEQYAGRLARKNK